MSVFAGIAFSRIKQKTNHRIDMAFRKVRFVFEPCGYLKRQNCVCCQDFVSYGFFDIIHAQDRKLARKAMILLLSIAHAALFLHKKTPYKSTKYNDNKGICMQSLSVSDLFGIYIDTFYDKVTVKVKKSAIQRMNKYILPSIGEIQASLITPKDIYELILPIREKSETARKILSYTTGMFDLAAALGYAKANPVAGLRKILKIGGTKNHFASLKPDELHELKAIFNPESGINPIISRMILLDALTLLRIGSLSSLKWNMIDMEGKTAIIPAENMKTRHQFRFPITASSAWLLNEIRQDNEIKNIKSEFIFPGRKEGEHFSQNGPAQALRKTKLKNKMVMHGLRATGRTWLAEQKDIRFEVAEACLAHFEKSSTVRAYARTDYLEERREAMERWDRFVAEQLDLPTIRK